MSSKTEHYNLGVDETTIYFRDFILKALVGPLTHEVLQYCGLVLHIMS